MADCEMSHLNYQQVIVMVASTFGDGEPPNNGEEFKKKLEEMCKSNSKIKYLKEPPRYVAIVYNATSFFCLSEQLIYLII